MRELHLKLRTLSLDNTTCPDSERYSFLKEIITLDKKRVSNWDIYDHYIIGSSSSTSVNPEPDVVNPTDEAKKSKPKKAKSTAKRTTKKTAKKE